MNANLKNETYKLAKSYMDSGEGVRIYTSENEILEISGQERKNYESLRAVFINQLSDIVRVESLVKAEAEKLTPAEQEALEALNRGQNENNEFTNIGLEEIKDEVKKRTKNVSKPRVEKVRIGGMEFSEGGASVILTPAQVEFFRHMPDTSSWDYGLDSSPWIDVLCDEIGGMFAGKPMTVGAMISTLREKGMLTVGVERMNGKKAKFFELTELGKRAAKEIGLK